jgi:hypothetical protein
MIEGVTPNTNPVGRRRVRVTPEQVRELKDPGCFIAKARKRESAQDWDGVSDAPVPVD